MAVSGREQGAAAPGPRGDPVQQHPRRQLWQRFIQEGCAHGQSIPGLAGQGGDGSRFMKSTGRSQLPLAKSCLDHSSRAGLPSQDVMANCHRSVSPILGRGSDRSRDWM